MYYTYMYTLYTYVPIYYRGVRCCPGRAGSAAALPAFFRAELILIITTITIIMKYDMLLIACE